MAGLRDPVGGWLYSGPITTIQIVALLHCEHPLQAREVLHILKMLIFTIQLTVSVITTLMCGMSTI